MATSTPRPGGSDDPVRIQQEAARVSVTHRGPTADRYESALERYVGAVAGEHAHPAGTPGAFPPRTVGDVMTRSVVSAYEKAVFKEVASSLARNRISGVPVINEERHVVGVITTSDLLARLAGTTGGPPRGHRVARAEDKRKRHAMTAAELMTSPAITVTPTTSIADAARKAAKARVRTLPVVDASGRLAGVVTRADLIRQFLRPDADIARDVDRDVVRRPGVPGRSGVHIEVDEGVVTLSGQVDTVLTARRLVYETYDVPGVVGVVDELHHEITENLLPG